MPTRRAAAFFDLDNTVIQGASLFHLAKGLYRRGFFPTRVILKGSGYRPTFGSSAGRTRGHIEDARSATLGSSKATLSPSSTKSAMRSTRSRSPSRIWPGTRAHRAAASRCRSAGLAGHRRPGRGRRVIAARLGLTGALGTTAEHVDGVYTGRLKGELLHGPAKAEAVRA